MLELAYTNLKHYLDVNPLMLEVILMETRNCVKKTYDNLFTKNFFHES